MKNRDFEDLDVDVNTKIISRTHTEINSIPCVYEIWNWDGLLGESIVFYKEDIVSFSDDDIIELISNQLSKNLKKYTITRESKFVFINFNFETL